MAKKKTMYVIETSDPNGEFVHSAWAGEGYPRKSDAKAHLDFWKRNGMFKNETLTIGVEDAPDGFYGW